MRPWPLCLVALCLLNPLRGLADTADEFVRQADRDGDGQLLREEFPPPLRPLFDRLDANRDGLVSPAEYRALATLTPAERTPLLPPPTVADEPYGADPAQRFDFWRCPGAEASPVVVYFHGGGFQVGDKSDLPLAWLERFLTARISVVSANYRLSATATFPAPMRDGGRVVQQLRAHAGRYGLDPDRVGLLGTSAGGGLALWLAAHDDLARPDDPDPVARHSTKPTCVAVFAPQASYDPRWQTTLFATDQVEPALLALFGLTDPARLADPELAGPLADASTIDHLDPGDPPVWLFYPQPDTPLPDRPPGSLYIHHPRQGHALQAALTRAGVPHTLKLRSDFADAEVGRAPLRELAAFCVEQLAAPLDRPLHALSWSPVPNDCEHVTPLLWVRRDSDPAALAEVSRTRPPGRAALFLWDLARPLLDQSEDRCRTAAGELTTHRGLWADRGVALVKATAEAFFAAYRAAGGRLDYLVLDYESGFSNWHLGAEAIRAVDADPRSAEIKRELGLDSLETIADWRRGTDYLRWNALLAERLDRFCDEAIFDVARRHFPAVKASNYGATITVEAEAMPDVNGHRQWRPSAAGTHGSQAYYGEIGQLARVRLDGQEPYGATDFAALRYEINKFRATRRSSVLPHQPWVSHWAYANSRFREGGLYRELIYHLALGGVEDFLYWNPNSWRADQDPSQWRTDDQDRLLDGCLAELNRRLTPGRRRPLRTELLSWDTPLVVSGMRLGKRDIYRLSAPAGIEQVTVGDRLITLDDGRGAWLEVPAGTPVTGAPAP